MWNGARGRATFATDGGYRFESDSKPGNPRLVVSGKYREDQDLLFLTFERVDFENLPAAWKSQESEMKKKSEEAFDVGTEMSCNVQWKGKDRFETASPDGKQAKFTRAR